MRGASGAEAPQGDANHAMPCRAGEGSSQARARSPGPAFSVTSKRLCSHCWLVGTCSRECALTRRDTFSQPWLPRLSPTNGLWIPPPPRTEGGARRFQFLSCHLSTELLSPQIWLQPYDATGRSYHNYMTLSSICSAKLSGTRGYGRLPDGGRCRKLWPS